MAKNWLYINGGNVVYVLTQDPTPTSADCPVTYDTLAQDDSQTFQVGDTFTADLQLQYNKEIWTQMGWLSANTSNTNTSNTA
jgi:hypothetical protein